MLSLSIIAMAGTLFVHAVTPAGWILVIFSEVGGFGAGPIYAGIKNYVAKYSSTRTMHWL